MYSRSGLTCRRNKMLCLSQSKVCDDTCWTKKITHSCSGNNCIVICPFPILKIQAGFPVNIYQMTRHDDQTLFAPCVTMVTLDSRKCHANCHNSVFDCLYIVCYISYISPLFPYFLSIVSIPVVSSLYDLYTWIQLTSAHTCVQCPSLYSVQCTPLRHRYQTCLCVGS